MAAEVFGGLVAGLRTVFVTRTELDRVNDSFPSMGELVHRIQKLEDQLAKLEDQLAVHQFVIESMGAPARVRREAEVDYSRGAHSR
jgi:hypothetical protein